MSNETDILSEADEFAALLPWYVTGKISAADRAFVEAYAKAHPEAQAQIAVAREEADIIFSADASLEVPRHALDKLMASVAASPSARIASARTTIADRIGEFLASLAPRQLAYAGMTAALAIAVLAGTLGSVISGSGQGYTTVTKDDSVSAATGTFALVSFQPAAPAATLSAFLAENNLAIVDGPRAGGIYRVRLSGEVLNKDAAEAALAKLKARGDLISFAASAPNGG